MKMFKTSLVALAALAATGAHAFGNTATATASPRAEASAQAAGGSATAHGGAGGHASNNVRNDVTSVQLQGQHQTAFSGGNRLTNEGNNSKQSTSVVIEDARNPVASAFAAPLAASNGTCMGSTSAGAQGVTIGVSVGTTWTDSSCDARYDAQALASLGQPVAALARLCQKAEIAAAVEASGAKCPAKSAPVKTSTASPATGYDTTDPFIRSRLGLN